MKRVLIPALALGGALFMLPALAADGEALYQSKACVACHAIDSQKVGPAYQAVAAKYAGKEDAVTLLVDSIQNGSKDKWGSIPMPPNAVSDEEAKILAEWIMKQK